MWKKIQREYEKLLKEKEQGIVKNYKEALEAYNKIKESETDK